MTTIRADRVELLVITPSTSVLAEAEEVRRSAVAEAVASGLPTPEIAEACAGWAGTWRRALFLVWRCTLLARTGRPYFKGPDDVEQREDEATYLAFRALSPYLDDGR